MGLDITAVSKAVWGRDGSDEYDGYDDNLVSAYQNGDFPDQFDYLKDGWYRVDGETFRFRAGSYGGYGAWRRSLCAQALGVDVEEIWDNPEAFKGRPFFELINFSDCEGTIGPVTSAKLAKDFKDYEGKIFTGGGRIDFYLETYHDFAKAFALASDGGFVDFH